MRVHAPSQHAGEYIMMLRGEGEAALKAFLTHRSQQWNREPRQKIWRCVDHVCKYMAYMVEENARGGTKDLEISYEEMRSFFMQRKRGARIKSVLTSRLTDGTFAASLVSVRPPPHRRTALNLAPNPHLHPDPYPRPMYFYPHHRAHPNPNLTTILTRQVREKLMDLLGSVAIFQTLEATQIELLLDHMSNAPFKKGESVFEQVRPTLPPKAESEF